MNNGPNPEEILDKSLMIKAMCEDLNRKMLLLNQGAISTKEENKPFITPSHRLAMQQRLESPIIELSDKKQATTQRRITPTVVSPTPVRSTSEISAVESLLNLEQPPVRLPKPFPETKPPVRPTMSVSPFSIKKN